MRKTVLCSWDFSLSAFWRTLCVDLLFLISVGSSDGMAVAMGAIAVANALFFCRILLSQSIMGIPEYWYQEDLLQNRHGA